jgi:NAD(P)-dependent dehydrogenase (short-subunit alcohol dehydrogenase family)
MIAFIAFTASIYSMSGQAFSAPRAGGPWVWTAAGVAAGFGAAMYLWRRAHPHYSLRGRVVLIAGGSRGLGYALALECLRQGARVALAAQDAAALRRAEEKLSPLGEVMTYTCDLREPDAAATLVAAVPSHWGPVDVLINNAGVMTVGPWQSMTEDDFAQALAIHFWSPLRLIRAVLPAMQARGEGRIINIASIGAIVPVPRMLPYTVSKFALAGLSDAWATELRGTGVRVTTVFPWLMRTGSQEGARFKGRADAEFAWFATSVLPGVSVSAHAAARRIVRAARRGQRRLVVGWPAKLAALGQGVAPTLAAHALSLMHALLPSDSSADSTARRGADSHSPLTRRWLAPRLHLDANEFNQPSRTPAELNQPAYPDADRVVEPKSSAASTKTG